MSKNRKYAPYPIAVATDGYHAKYPEIADAQPSDVMEFPKGSVAYPMLEYGATNIYTESLYGAKNGEDWGVAPTSSWSKQVKPPNANRIKELVSGNLIDATIESIPEWEKEGSRGATILDATVRSSYIFGVFANMGGLLLKKGLGISEAEEKVKRAQEEIDSSKEPFWKDCSSWNW